MKDFALTVAFVLGLFLGGPIIMRTLWYLLDYYVIYLAFIFGVPSASI